MKTFARSLVLVGLLIAAVGSFAVAADKPAVAPPNYDESKIPAYTLPDLLVMQDGTKVTDAETWRTKRRPEVLKLFETYMYGRTVAGRSEKMTFEVLESADDALGGKAIRKQVRVKFTGKDDGPGMDLLIYAPKSAASKPAPAFVMLNFQGNHTTTTDPAVRLGMTYDRRTGKAAQAWLAREAAEAKALHRAALRLWDRQRYADDPMRAAGAKAGFDFFVQRLESTAKLVGTMACRRTKARAKPARQRTRNS